jgi:hypothetical protein
MGRLIIDEHWPAWLTGEFARAVRANLSDIEAGRLEAAAKCAECSPLKAARRLAAWIFADVPYQFDGDAHQIAPWLECESRGYAACADAAALAAACLIAAGHFGVKACYETVPGFPDYAHVRVHVAETLVEPWPHARRPVDSCTLLVEVRSLLDA